MAVCKFCRKDMLRASGCIEVPFKFGEKKMKPVRCTDEEAPDGGRCHDCGCKAGYFHHSGCDMERCPSCGGQAISCGCADEEEV